MAFNQSDSVARRLLADKFCRKLIRKSSGGGCLYVTSDPTVQGTVKTILWHKTPSRLGEREDMKVGGARWGSVRML